MDWYIYVAIVVLVGMLIAFLKWVGDDIKKMVEEDRKREDITQ